MDTLLRYSKRRHFLETKYSKISSMKNTFAVLYLHPLKGKGNILPRMSLCHYSAITPARHLCMSQYFNPVPSMFMQFSQFRNEEERGHGHFLLPKINSNSAAWRCDRGRDLAYTTNNSF